MDLDRVIAVRNSKTVYRDGENCIKVFDSDYSKADVLNEALNQARVEEIGLHVPRVLEVATIDGKWAIVSEYIKGKTLTQLMQENPDRVDEYKNLFVDLQLMVQSKTCAQLARLDIKLGGKIMQADVDLVTRHDLYARMEAMARHANICHGDFRPSNIVLTADGTPFILDWSHVTQGHPAADAAHTYLYLSLKTGEEAAEEYLARYCEKSGLGKQSVRRWIPVVAAAQSVKCNAQEREFLLRWASVVD